MKYYTRFLNPVGKKLKGAYSINSLVGIALAFVIVTVVFALGGRVLDDFQSEMTTNSYAYNATNEGLEAISDMSTWLPLLGLVVIAAVLIGVLITSMVRGMSPGGGA